MTASGSRGSPNGSGSGEERFIWISTRTSFADGVEQVSATQIVGSFGLAIDHPFSRVMASIQLDRELQLCRIEIDDVATDWMLTAKFPLAESARAQPSSNPR